LKDDFVFQCTTNLEYVRRKGKGKAVPLQAWSGAELFRKLMFPDFMTTAL